MAHLGGIAPVCLERGSEVHRRFVVAALGSEEPPLGVQVGYHRDVALPSAQAGFVDAHYVHALEGLLRSGLVDVDINEAPQLLVCATQHRGRLAHRQFPTQRQRPHLEGSRVARRRPRPGHSKLGGLVAGIARHARHIRVQPGLKLEAVQVRPGPGSMPFRVERNVDSPGLRRPPILPRFPLAAAGESPAAVRPADQESLGRKPFDELFQRDT